MDITGFKEEELRKLTKPHKDSGKEDNGQKVVSRIEVPRVLGQYWR